VARAVNLGMSAKGSFCVRGQFLFPFPVELEMVDIAQPKDLPESSPTSPDTRNVQTTLLKVHRSLCLFFGQPVCLAQSATCLRVRMPWRRSRSPALHIAELYTFCWHDCCENEGG
jgi:hypothetical protein